MRAPTLFIDTRITWWVSKLIEIHKSVSEMPSPWKGTSRDQMQQVLLPAVSDLVHQVWFLWGSLDYMLMRWVSWPWPFSLSMKDSWTIELLQKVESHIYDFVPALVPDFSFQCCVGANPVPYLWSWCCCLCAMTDVWRRSACCSSFHKRCR